MSQGTISKSVIKCSYNLHSPYPLCRYTSDPIHNVVTQSWEVRTGLLGSNTGKPDRNHLESGTLVRGGDNFLHA